MTAEERLLNLLFTKIKGKKDIHDLTEEEKTECSNGYNTAIEIVVNDFVVTGGTLKERCLLADSDVNMADSLKKTTIEEILKVTEEGEEVMLYIFEDVIMVMSDIHFVSYEDETCFLPISSDLTVFERTTVEIIDLR